MPADSSAEHLAELRRRWQEEPGSRLFLQLAEEYRRAGRHGEAVEVLEKGLEIHPRHVSAHVALGRARLETGEAAAAVACLERALELDATNLVANKLLVEAYLARGERERARQRLDLYGLLNDGDPDIADLRRRVATREAPPSDRGALGPAGERRGPVDLREEGEATVDELLGEGLSWGGEATGESLAAPPSAGEQAPPHAAADVVHSEGWEDALEEEPMTTRSGPSIEREVVQARDTAEPEAETPGEATEPFGDLAAGGAARRYLQGFAGDGLFRISEEAPPPPEPPPESLPEPRPAEILEVADRRGPPALRAPAAAEQGDEPPRDRPTVTLGQLYLDQRHFAQARRVFAALLEEEPGHEVARRGLERAERELAAAGPEAVTAADLLREAEPGQPARRAMLGAYLARILRPRESARPDVPR